MIAAQTLSLSCHAWSLHDQAGREMGPRLEELRMANPEPLAVASREQGAHRHPLLPGGGAPQHRWEAPTPGEGLELNGQHFPLGGRP